MEELCRELDDLRSEMRTLREQYLDKLVLSENLRQAHKEQMAQLQEARVQIEKQAKEIDAKVEEISLFKEKYEEIESQFAEKESALRKLDLMNENLKTSTRNKLMDFEVKNKELSLTLDEANTKLEEQERSICSYKEEIEGLKVLLSASLKRCSDAELRAQASKELSRREEILLRLEEEKMDTENQLKWKIEQFEHLEDAHGKLQEEFRVAKKDWGSERSTLVNEIQTLQTKLDSQAVLIEDLRSRLKMCNQALAHEESRRKLLEIQISESKTLYNNVLSDYAEARSTIEAMTAKQDDEIASLRISLATKTALHKEMEFRRTQLEQENQELQASLREFQDAQVAGAYTASSTKTLRSKFAALQHAHKSCSEKLKNKEVEWKTQVEKLEKDLNSCLCQLISKDKQHLDMQLELEDCQSSLMLQKLNSDEIATVLMLVESKFSESCSLIENMKNQIAQHKAKDLNSCRCQFVSREKQLLDLQHELETCESSLLLQKLDNIELTTVLMVVQSKFFESCSVIEKLKLEMAQHKAGVADRNVLVEQLERKNYALIQAQAETQKGHGTIESLQSKVEYLESVAHKYYVTQKEIDTCRGMLDESHHTINHIKEQASKKENTLQYDLRKALEDLDRANHALAVKTTEQSKMEFELHQQNLVIKRMEKVKLDLETELNHCRDEIQKIKNTLDASVVEKKEAEKELRQLKEYTYKLNFENSNLIEELQKNVRFLEENKERREIEISTQFKSEAEKISEKEKKLFELAKVIDRILMETLEAIDMLEEKFTSRQAEILRIFDQEIAKYSHVMKDNEEIIVGLQDHITLLERDAYQVIEMSTSQLEDKKVDIHTLSDVLDRITAFYVLKEHESEFGTSLSAELEDEVNTLKSNLKSLESLSSNSKNYADQLRAEMSLQCLKNEQKNARILNELEVLQAEKINLVDQLRKLATKIEALHYTNTKLLLEKEELFQQMTELSDMMSLINHVDEELAGNCERIVRKTLHDYTISRSVNKDLHCTDIVDNKIHVSPVKSNAQHRYGKRSPLKEHNC